MAIPGIIMATRPATQRRPNSHYSRTHRLANWLAPSLLDAVRLLPRAEHTVAPESDDLRGTLEQLRASLRRAWRVTMLRRSLLCGLLLGLVVAIALDLAHGPGWPGVVFAALSAAVIALWLGQRAPGTEATARYLDSELDLKEQLATALELTKVPSHASFLGPRVQQGAIAAARSAIGAWSARGIAATREWVALGVLLCALAAVALIPHSGSAVPHPPAAPLAGNGTNSGDALASVPPIQASSRSLPVQVAVVSTPDTTALPGTKSVHAIQPQAHATAVPRVATAHGSVAPTHAPGGSSGSAGKGTAPTSQHALPFVKGSESFLPTSPSKSGQKSSLVVGSQSKGGKPNAGTQGGTAGAAKNGVAGAAASTAKGSSSQGGKGAGSQKAGSGTSGKPGASAGAANQCLYGCKQLSPSMLSKPGLITGKGQFTGTGTPGGKTAGHARGSAPTLGGAKTSLPSTKSHQLSITSAYGPRNAQGQAAKQVEGHNGAGSAEAAVVAAGANGSQSIDYVPPDANLLPPDEDAIVSRYFTSHSSS